MISTNTNQDHAAFALRLSLGTILLAHGLLKLLVFTPSGTAAYFASLGLPEVLAYLTILIEVGGGILLIVGVLSRLVSLVSLPILAGATWAHLGNGWLFSNQGAAGYLGCHRSLPRRWSLCSQRLNADSQHNLPVPHY